jgi:NitT/TauT family transport system substrate-binding protein
VAKAVTVHLGYFPNLTHAPALVGIAQGIFARDLAPDTLATTTFSAGPAENQALLSGSLDIAFEGPSSALSAYSSSHGAIAIVAGAASGGAGLVTRPTIT